MKKSVNHRLAAGVAGVSLLLLAASSGPEPADLAGPEPAAPVTPRDFYNEGTRKLRAGKLKDAESFLQMALAAQVDRVRFPAVFNLGEVRFGQGVEELKKGPAAGPTAARGQAAARMADEAIRGADEALAGNDVRTMVNAYLRGRGVRRELKAATKAVKKAMEVYGTALRKWRRASDDFKSALELNPADADARHNADVVDRCIAKLVDSLHELEQAANAMGDKQEKLAEKMEQLKGRIPAPDMPPGAAGDDEEEEDMPMGPEQGQKEGPTKEGEEMSVSPEQAGWILDGFKLDGERRLPMGDGEPTPPRDRNRPTW